MIGDTISKYRSAIRLPFLRSFIDDACGESQGFWLQTNSNSIRYSDTKTDLYASLPVPSVNPICKDLSPAKGLPEEICGFC